VFIGLMVSFPVAFGVLTFAQSIDLSVGATALMQTVVFTCLALLRKYLVRLFFLQSQK
jgi:MFS superfamily sulfate permease-like transporter